MSDRIRCAVCDEEFDRDELNPSDEGLVCEECLDLMESEDDEGDNDE